MFLTTQDHRDVVVLLFAGLHQDPPWQQFLQNLRLRTGASAAGLVLHGPDGASLEYWSTTGSAAPTPEIGLLAEAGLPAPTSLRPGRVYALDELLDFDVPGAQEGQRRLLDAHGIRHARLLHVGGSARRDASLLIVHPKNDFSAIDSALLSALALPLAQALLLLDEIQGWRQRAALAEETLEALGIAQITLDAAGRVLSADDLSRRSLEIQPGARLILPARASQELSDALAGLDRGAPGTRRVVRLGGSPPREAMVRPADPAHAVLPGVAATALVRTPVDPPATAGAAVLCAQYGLSSREAALALAIARGEPIVAAGKALGLTPETARNYSKRLYAKTGTNGQAALVRLVLTGLAPLA